MKVELSDMYTNRFVIPPSVTNSDFTKGVFEDLSLDQAYTGSHNSDSSTIFLTWNLELRSKDLTTVLLDMRTNQFMKCMPGETPSSFVTLHSAILASHAALQRVVRSASVYDFLIGYKPGPVDFERAVLYALELLK
ncbi:MAG: hypothetical protein QM764_20490 [Chitinophagaceae bacterium]